MSSYIVCIIYLHLVITYILPVYYLIIQTLIIICRNLKQVPGLIR